MVILITSICNKYICSIAAGASLELQTFDGDTALMAAVNSEQYSSVRDLVRYGALLDFVNPVTGWGPVHYACSIGNISLVKLFSDSGADINQLLPCGTPLQISSACGHLRIVELLLSHGVHVNAQDDCGCSALHYAAQHGHVEVTSALLSASAEVNLRQANGASSLYLATYFGRNKVAEVLLRSNSRFTTAELAVAKQTENWHLVRILEAVSNGNTFI